MKKELMAYNAPTSEALELRFEGVFCQSGLLYGNPGKAGDDFGDGGLFNL